MSKNVIITGTSRGIGFELVHLFANAGHKVLALSRNAQPVNNPLQKRQWTILKRFTKPTCLVLPN